MDSEEETEHTESEEEFPMGEPDSEYVEEWADLSLVNDLEDLQMHIAEHKARVRNQISYNEFHTWKAYIETTPAASYLRQLLNASNQVSGSSWQT